MDLSPAIHIEQLNFTYAGEKTRVIERLNLDVPRGARYGLFGPNGAGKTTLMSCVCGLLPVSEGTVAVFGESVGESAARGLGLVPQDFAFYNELTVHENLAYFGAMYGIFGKELRGRIAELTSRLDLEQVTTKKAEQLSGGYKRRLNLAIGVLHEPELLILDEPTVGVDVQTRRELIAFLRELNQKGTTIFYTSHQLAEAEELCEEVALIRAGSIIAAGRLEELLSRSGNSSLEDFFIQKTAG